MLKLKMGTSLEDKEPGKVLNYSFFIKYYGSQKKEKYILRELKKEKMLSYNLYLVELSWRVWVNVSSYLQTKQYNND